jgi:hypothetical protein
MQLVFNRTEIAMQNFRSASLAGIAAVALIGSAGAAVAQSADTHVMQVRLPDGGIGEIYYTGNVPPKVVITSAPAFLAAFDPMPSLFGPDSPFAMMERISAEMDQQMATMLARAEGLAVQARSGSPQAVETSFGNLPPGTTGYSYISTMSSNGVCTRSMQITSTGSGAPPKVVSHSSGNCGSESGAAPGDNAPVNLPVARPPAINGPDLIQTKAKEPKLYTTMVRQVANSSR